MEIYKIKDLSFAYPNRETDVLKNVNLSVNTGDFVLVCGKSGCGKSTLLRLLKTNLSPFGRVTGEILYNGRPLNEAKVTDTGFVMQNPDSQIVTDKVWHELAFGLESLGVKTAEIRRRVAETASFFGIQNWFYKKTSELSGGQKQLLSLAAAMIMQPEVLILDEPTSQLDPIAAAEFINTLRKINDELGTTIIIAEHRLEEVFSVADKVVVMDDGEIIADDEPKNIGLCLKNHDMFEALPAPIRVFADIDNSILTVGEGRRKLLDYADNNRLDNRLIPHDKDVTRTSAIEVKNVYFRYEKNEPDVIKELNFTVCKGEIFAITGGNGTGKTTAISLISGLNTAQRGKIYINGTEISKIRNLYSLVGLVPQNPQTLLVRKTVFLNLLEATDENLSKDERKNQVQKTASLCRIEHLLENHPYDLSGGEQERVAIATVLLRKVQILILDEPTKGMDASFKKEFASVLQKLKANGVTVLMVSHDVEFCAEFADRCAMFFDGSITSLDTPRRFFSGNSFYTTSANRMAGKLLPDAILAEDIIAAMGGEVPKKEIKHAVQLPQKECEKKKQTLGVKRLLCGILFMLFALISHIFEDGEYIFQVVTIVFVTFATACFFPRKEISIHTEKNEKTFNKRSVITMLICLFAVSYTIFVMGDKQYYFTGILIILEAIISFVTVHGRKIRMREIVVISALCAIAVVGRITFYMLPEFKPAVAIVAISGICFGGETGFIVGVLTGFVSNFFFGHGPWTPWQMLAFGIIGFISGLLFKNGFLPKTRGAFAVFGFLATLIVYGCIMNTASVVMMTSAPTWEMLKTAYLVGLPVDTVHAVSSAFFLWFLSEPMLEKLDRLKVKYGLI